MSRRDKKTTLKYFVYNNGYVYTKNYKLFRMLSEEEVDFLENIKKVNWDYYIENPDEIIIDRGLSIKEIRKKLKLKEDPKNPITMITIPTEIVINSKKDIPLISKI